MSDASANHLLPPETFWQLLGRYRVKIPLLQRDYAQGRNDPQVDQVRGDFVMAIVTAARPGGTARLDLGLVYGTTRADADPPQLALIDGQQRLTTTFLAHWFLAWRGAAAAEHEDIARRLGRFTYETRASARDFCLALTSRGLGLAPGGVIAAIEDAPWFFSTWRRDPTVGAMLVMLGEIERQFADDAKEGEDYPARWARLTAAGPGAVFFRFLPMSDHRLTDDLYLKMNARGRTLTEFEKFKAWLERHVEKEFTPEQQRGLAGPAKSWQEEIDLDWTDFFWKHSGRQPEKMHADFLRFFKATALNHFIAALKDTEVVKKLVDEVSGDGFMPTASLEKLFTFEAVRDTFRVLRKLSGGALETLSEKELFEKFAAATATYKTRVDFHALCRFLIGHKEPYDATACRRWMRVVWCLTGNTSINEPADFGRLVTTIQRSAPEASGDVHRWLAAEPGPKLDGFSPYQIREEKRKARLARAGHEETESTRPNDGQGWEAALAEAEIHSFFNGQITFLLDLRQAGDGPEALFQFRVDADVARRVFDRMLWRGPEYLVERALLVQGDYLLHLGGETYRFGADDRDWRGQVFRVDHRIEYVHQLLRQLTPGQEETSLRGIIAEELAKPWPADDSQNWRRALIDCPALFEFCKQRNVRFEWDGHYFLLLDKKSRRKGAPCRELRVHRFYHKHLLDRDGDFRPFTVGYEEKGDADNYGLPFPRLDCPDYAINVRYLSEPPPKAGYYRLELIRKDRQSLPVEIVEHFAAPQEPSHDLSKKSEGRIHLRYGDEIEAIGALYWLSSKLSA